MFDPEKLKVKLMNPTHQVLPNTDMAIWSAIGRYLFASISGKKSTENSAEKGVVQVWNSLTNHLTMDLAQECGVQTFYQTLVLAPHPRDEEILVTGSGKGKIYLWNVAERSLLKEFTEYDNYTLGSFTFNDAIDGQFSPDGKDLIIGSLYGSLSLFSCQGSDDAFELTPVQQFMQFED